MKLKIASALLAMSSVSLSGCGFTPVYGNNIAAETGSIQIEQIQGATGHVLRRELLLLLRPGLDGVESGRLVIDLKEENQLFTINKRGENVRTAINAIARYNLTTDKGVIRGRVTGTSSFFAANLPYDDIFARREASNRAAMDAARKIASDLQIQVGREDAFLMSDRARALDEQERLEEEREEDSFLGDTP